MRLRTPAAFFLTLGVLGGGLVLGSQAAKTAYGAGKGSSYEGLDTLARALSHVEENYAEELDINELIYSAIDGVAASLDRHSHFFDPDEYRRLKEDNEGNYFGVGVEVRPHPQGGLKVVGVIPGGPAEAAKMQEDDQIVSVDGKDVLLEPFEETVAKIRGPRGVPVTLGLVRNGQAMTLTVIRDAVHTASVRSEWVGQGVGYAYISQFQQKSTDELNQHLHELKAQGKGRFRALILDMRKNPGGLLDEAVATVDLFVKEGQIVTTEGRSQFAMDAFSAGPGAQLSDGRLSEDEVWEDQLDLFVLIDGDSASASEIVAGALQDLDRAEILGEKSYGKGSVQSIFEYGDETALKLTIGRYHLPSGRSIEIDGGVEPDLVIPYFSAENPADALRNELLNMELTWSQFQQMDALLNQIHPPAEEAPPHRFRNPVKERIQWDPQLKKALELAQKASQ